MSRKKEDPSKAVLSSSQTEGQGTTARELPGGSPADSSRSKKKK
jgi:YuzL-like protein